MTINFVIKSPVCHDIIDIRNNHSESRIEPLIFATNYYCDPVSGSMANDGSKSNPWSTLQAVFESRKTFVAGDSIFLY